MADNNEVQTNALFESSEGYLYDIVNAVSQELERDLRRYNRAFIEESEVGAN